MPSSNRLSKEASIKLSGSEKRRQSYLTKLSEDLKKFREREAAGEEISKRERRNMRARERRAIRKMRETAQPLIKQANSVLDKLREKKIETLTRQRLEDDFKKTGRYYFSVDEAKSYNEIVSEITRASSFLNAPDTNAVTGERIARNQYLQSTYGEKAIQSLKSGDFISNGLIPTAEDAKEIFRNYRKVEKTWQGLIGKEGQKGVYGSDNLILYMIDVHNKGLDEELYGMKALENFQLETLPEFSELLEERNRATCLNVFIVHPPRG